MSRQIQITKHSSLSKTVVIIETEEKTKIKNVMTNARSSLAQIFKLTHSVSYFGITIHFTNIAEHYLHLQFIHQQFIQ